MDYVFSCFQKNNNIQLARFYINQHIKNGRFKNDYGFDIGGIWKYESYFYILESIINYFGNKAKVLEISSGSYDKKGKKIYSILEEQSLSIPTVQGAYKVFQELSNHKELSTTELQKYNCFTSTVTDNSKLTLMLLKVMYIYTFRNNSIINYSTFEKEYISINADITDIHDYRTVMELSYNRFCLTYSKKDEVFLKIYSQSTSDFFYECWLDNLIDNQYKLRFDKQRKKYCFRAEKHETLLHKNDPKVFKGLNEFDTILINVFTLSRDAINNRKNSSEIFSYSSSLGVPLFKYYFQSALIMKELNLNTLKLNAEYDLFYWYVDDEGNRYQQIFLHELEIPFNTFIKKRKFLELLEDYLIPEIPSKFLSRLGDSEIIEYDLDIDDIRIESLDFTLDLSSFNRQDLNVFLEISKEEILKSVASFKKDKEIITTEQINSEKDWILNHGNSLLYLRMYYLLCIFQSDKTDYFESILFNKSLSSNLLNFPIQDKPTLELLFRYIKNNKHFERDTFDEIQNIKENKDTWNQVKQELLYVTSKELHNHLNSIWDYLFQVKLI